MNTKHTAGPWYVIGSNPPMIYTKDALDIICQCDSAGEMTRAQEQANARLIAAAPELLELLEGLTFIAETVAHLRGLEREILPTTDKARELIARVKG